MIQYLSNYLMIGVQMPLKTSRIGVQRVVGMALGTVFSSGRNSGHQPWTGSTEPVFMLRRRPTICVAPCSLVFCAIPMAVATSASGSLMTPIPGSVSTTARAGARRQTWAKFLKSLQARQRNLPQECQAILQMTRRPLTLDRRGALLGRGTRSSTAPSIMSSAGCQRENPLALSPLDSFRSPLTLEMEYIYDSALTSQNIQDMRL